MDRRMDHRHHDGGLVCSEVCVVSCAAIGGTTTHLHSSLPGDIDVVPHQSHPLAQELCGAVRAVLSQTPWERGVERYGRKLMREQADAGGVQQAEESPVGQDSPLPSSVADSESSASSSKQFVSSCVHNICTFVAVFQSSRWQVLMMF